MTAFAPTTTASAAAVQDALLRRVLTPVTVVTALVALAFAALDVARVEVPQPLQVAPFAISLVLFGLPHGALDHLVPTRVDPRVGRARSILVVVALYALLGGATCVVWIAAPVVGFALFIAVTWFHWGQGDLWVDRALRGVRPSALDGVVATAARGALPMLLPLASHPGDYLAVARSTTGLLGASATPTPSPLVLGGLQVVAGGCALALVVLHLALRARRPGGVHAVAVECAVLIVFFLTVPPVLAVGLYFTFWHAVRHIVRLELLRPGGVEALARGRLLGPFGRFMKDAAPMTVAAIVLLVALGVVLGDAGLGTYLLLIAALTTPHAVIVAWMDHRRTRRTPAARDPSVSTS